MCSLLSINVYLKKKSGSRSCTCCDASPYRALRVRRTQLRLSIMHDTPLCAWSTILCPRERLARTDSWPWSRRRCVDRLITTMSHSLRSQVVCWRGGAIRSPPMIIHWFSPSSRPIKRVNRRVPLVARDSIYSSCWRSDYNYCARLSDRPIVGDGFRSFESRAIQTVCTSIARITSEM